MEVLRPTEWIAKCAERLHDRWHTVEPAQLEEVAVDIWKNDQLRSMGPVDAAAFWLTPVVVVDSAEGTPTAQ
jgi:hypothetical protein